MTDSREPTGSEARAYETLRTVPPSDPELEQRLSRAARAAWRPAPSTFRPATVRWAAVATAVAATAAVLVFGGAPRRPPPPGVAASGASVGVGPRGAGVPTEFVYVGAPTSGVTLLGDFNDWDPTATRLRRVAPRLWTATVPLSPGLYAYSFLVDGERWEADRSAARSAPDDFGHPSSLVLVAEDR